MDKKGNLLASTRSVVTIGMDPHSVDEEDDAGISLNPEGTGNVCIL